MILNLSVNILPKSVLSFKKLFLIYCLQKNIRNVEKSTHFFTGIILTTLDKTPHKQGFNKIVSGWQYFIYDL